ncbi:uncharacterized protein LOC108042783 isoform X2 [Drosophila rhopaloa]|uniref:Uncharacterized protein LOC108042783 isoform X2 n=1 Tax=Drosophila rhopaloa TaxID=1041015 RepID=A0A6P4EEU4_DRORH|nr:uncharacterized protein LOC108042783 isoform X2 [Drosophila rhopaloa]
MLLKTVDINETLAKDVFQQRLKTLNARVKFPEDAVRLALLKSDPSHAEFADSKHESSILSLKYSMVNTAVPLKWNWHLSPLNNAQFYREVCMNSVSTTGGLRDQVSFLIEVLRSKDKELKQFRTEGCKLRRVTAVTKPFDIEAFKEEHQKLLEDASAYQKVKDVLAVEVPAMKSSAFAAPMPHDVKYKTPPTGSAGTVTPKLTPRNRKRKALESNINHMERKVMQRRSKPHIEYKSSQSSQETNVDDWFTENKPAVKKETMIEVDGPSTSAKINHESFSKLKKVDATVGTTTIKSEPVQENASKEGGFFSSSDEDEEELERSFEKVEIIPQNPASVQEIVDSPIEAIAKIETLVSEVEYEVPENGLTELDEIKAILKRTTAITKKLIEKHEVNK